MTDNATSPPGRDAARPDHGDLIRYQRIYLAGLSHAELNLSWEQAYAHALLLEQEPDRIHDGHGRLSGRQLGEGADLQSAADRPVNLPRSCLAPWRSAQPEQWLLES